MSASTAVEVRDAATVVLLRDGPDGLEVAMLRRRLESEFVSGAYVFPGGAVDDHDREPDWADVCDGLTDVAASAALEMESGGLAYWVAAVRECFEEAGVLLAHHRDGAPVAFGDAALAERFDGHRADVDGQHRTLLDVCHDESLRLDVALMHPFGHFITPQGAPRRYDTRFFVAVAPEGQPLRHDDDETIDGLWICPADALERNAAGDYELIMPTLLTLKTLAHHRRANDVVGASR